MLEPRYDYHGTRMYWEEVPDFEPWETHPPIPLVVSPTELVDVFELRLGGGWRLIDDCPNCGRTDAVVVDGVVKHICMEDER